MTNILEMAEAHLMNIQREIQVLEQRKIEIDKEISRLSEYLEGGVVAVSDAKSEASAALDSPTATPLSDLSSITED
tara:strand:+ start:1203 stop:1430 length:228 start_codon:yes stop_codon:yes gene_type:complete